MYQRPGRGTPGGSYSVGSSGARRSLRHTTRLGLGFGF